MNKFFVFLELLLFMSIPFSITKVFGASLVEYKFSQYQNQKCPYNLISKIKNQRETTCNALNLDTNQIKYKNELDIKRYAQIEPLLEDLCNQHYVLNQLQLNNSTKSDILKQEKIIKNTQDNIRKISDDYDDEFIKVLDHNQKSKFAMIKSLQRNDYKKVTKIHRKGKKTSTLKTFGERISQPDYQQKIKKKFGDK